MDPDRARHLQGLVGDYTLRRAYDQCVACRQGHAPLDARLGLGPGSLSLGLLRKVVEIIDLYHAYEYLWAVGSAVFGAETPAAAWVEPLKTRRSEDGVAPVRAALEALRATLRTAAPVADADPDAENGPLLAVRRALEYVTTHAARLDYPAFVARQLPIGSSAVESAGKSVIQARTKGAGMRWSGAGAQQVVALRALHRSGRWEAF